MATPTASALGVEAPVYVGPWAGRPAAELSKDLSFVATDVGGRSTFYSDGAVWRPQGGRVALATLSGSIAAPVGAATSGNGEPLLLGLPGGAVRVPAGLLVPRESILRISAYWSKTGNAGLINCVTILGTTSSFTDSQLTGTRIGEAATAAWNMQIDVAVDTPSRVQVNSVPVLNGAVKGPLGTGEFAQSIDTAADMYVNFGATSAVGTDGLLLTRVLVEVFL